METTPPVHASNKSWNDDTKGVQRYVYSEDGILQSNILRDSRKRVVSNTQREGFQRLTIETRPVKPQEEKIPSKIEKTEEIEYSPYLKIAETRA